jgi:hypothetical protein
VQATHGLDRVVPFLLHQCIHAGFRLTLVLGFKPIAIIAIDAVAVAGPRDAAAIAPEIEVPAELVGMHALADKLDGANKCVEAVIQGAPRLCGEIVRLRKLLIVQHVLRDLRSIAGAPMSPDGHKKIQSGYRLHPLDCRELGKKESPEPHIGAQMNKRELQTNAGEFANSSRP